MRAKTIVTALSLLVVFVLLGGVYLATGETQEPAQPQQPAAPEELPGDAEQLGPYFGGSCDTPCVKTECGEPGVCFEEQFSPECVVTDLEVHCCDKGGGEVMDCGENATVHSRNCPCTVKPGETGVCHASATCYFCSL